MEPSPLGALGPIFFFFVICGFILCAAMAVLAFLLPFYVFAINAKLAALLKKVDQTNAVGSNVLTQNHARYETLQAQNGLLRQLLRAYGHEPES